MEQLIEAVAKYEDDWESISKVMFSGAKTVESCILKFLELPITEGLIAKVQQKAKPDRLSEKVNYLSKQTVPSVFMDTSNPLFSQVAIFARCLEEREERKEVAGGDRGGYSLK